MHNAASQCGTPSLPPITYDQFWSQRFTGSQNAFLTFITNAPRNVNLKGHGRGVEIKVGTSFFLENHLF